MIHLHLRATSKGIEDTAQEQWVEGTELCGTSVFKRKVEEDEEASKKLEKERSERREPKEKKVKKE